MSLESGVADSITKQAGKGKEDSISIIFPADLSGSGRTLPQT
ncbi:hypothetical protein [Anaerobutyricum hallii]